jgi:glycosyltransferase involved in cell wall biosynthesis
MVLPIAALVSIVRGAKLVYDAHELESAKNGSTYLVSRAILAFEWICWPRVDLLISVSPSIIKWYQERFSEKRSVVVLNAPTLSEGTTGHTRGALPRSERTYFRQMYGIPEGRLIFIYVGYFGVGRGIERMLQVFSSGAVESHLVFMGYGDLLEQIYCKTLESDNVHLHDPVPHERVVSVTQHADVGLCLIENVSLSDYYCLPNKLFEYAFAGVPVLASSFPDMSEVVDTYHLGSCTDPDVESITRAISEMEKAPPAPLTADFFPLSWEAQERVLREEYRRLLPEVGNDSAL